MQVYTTSVAHDMLYQLAGVEQKRQALCSSVGRGAPVLPVWSSELFTLDLRKNNQSCLRGTFQKLSTNNFWQVLDVETEPQGKEWKPACFNNFDLVPCWHCAKVQLLLWHHVSSCMCEAEWWNVYYPSAAEVGQSSSGVDWKESGEGGTASHWLVPSD